MLSDQDFNRIYWASRRGMLELDLVLMPFVEKRLRELDADRQQQYINLLESEDTELFAWFLQRERPANPALTGIVDEILAFTQRPQR
jgi:antitoxin CptB